MKKLACVFAAAALAVFVAAPATATHVELNGNGLPHIPYLETFRLNIHAFTSCPAGAFDGTNRRTIVVKASPIGGGHPDLLQTNDILLAFDPTNDRFQVLDGNACDADPAQLILPQLVSSQFEVYIRLVGQPGKKIDVALCGTIGIEILCATAFVKTRGTGKNALKFQDVTNNLLKINGSLLFSDITAPWWDWQADNHAKAQLVFVPVP